MEGNKALIVILLVVIFVGSLLFVSSFAMSQAMHSGASIGNSSAKTEKCATPSGYTDEQWREHMGHHPDIYTDCPR